MLRLLLFMSLLAFTISCDTKTSDDSKLQDFTDLLSGKFSSEKQSELDSSYPAVYLVNIPIWEDKPGYWLYHELYDKKNNSSVYNQRIINVRREDSVTLSTISYVIPNQKKYINAWRDISVFNFLTIDSLKRRDGCDVYFKKTSTIYQGKTKKGTCLSNFTENIAYTTSNVVVSKNKISSWDRGYDITGKQIWGKIQGPFQFVRINDY